MITIIAIISFYLFTMFLVGSWLAFTVFLLSYTMTIGHWENRQYGRPLLISTLCTIISTIVVIYMRSV